MKLLEQITQWLESEEKDFNQGLQMYMQASHNRSVMLYLQRKQDMQKLCYELQKLLNQVPARLNQLPAIVFASVSTMPAPKRAGKSPQPANHKILHHRDKINPDLLPDDLKKVYESIPDQYRIQRTLHEKMKLAASDDDRALIRKQLIEVDDYISKAWNAIDQYIKTGQPPAKEEKHPDVVKQINSARSYISKGLNALPGLNDEKRAARIAEIAKRVEILILNAVAVKKETRDELISLKIIAENSKLQVE